MIIEDVLSAMRAAYGDPDACCVDADTVYEWVRCIEAATREPVAKIDYVDWLEDGAVRMIQPLSKFGPGTKLFTFPPDAAGEIERLKEDAERYRFLRDENNWGCDNDETTESRWGDLGECHGGDFDAFVDKARAALAGDK